MEKGVLPSREILIKLVQPKVSEHIPLSSKMELLTLLILTLKRQIIHALVSSKEKNAENENTHNANEKLREN